MVTFFLKRPLRCVARSLNISRGTTLIIGFLGRNGGGIGTELGEDLSARAVSTLTVLWRGGTLAAGMWEGLLLFTLTGAGLETTN